MEPWRSRGYVPDSDDEEDLESQLTWEKKHADVSDVNLEDEANRLGSQDEDDKREQGKGIAEQHLPSLKLTPGRQAELVVCFDTGRDEIDSSSDELQVIDVVSKMSTVERTTKSSDVLIEAILSDDESDSPLSSPPSTDSSQENQFLMAQQNIEDHKIQPQRPDASPPETPRADTRPEIESSNTTLLDARRDNESEVGYWARRSLRQRKEIQLHPYQVEIARHRNQFKSAGIKPVHVTVEDANPSRQQEESQEDSVVEAEPSSSQGSEFIFPRSSPPDPYKSPNSISRRRTPKAGSHQTLPHAEDHVQKRRKLFHETSRTKQVDEASISVVIEQTHKSINKKNNLPFTEILPSPPRSGSTSSNTRLSKDGFRFPRGFAPPVLSDSNTPIRTTSTDFHDLTTEKANFDILSNPDDQISVQSLEEEDEDESDHDDDNDNLESSAPEKDVLEYQRKIKGVLPASWLTLDLKNKTGKPDRSSNEKHSRGPLASVTGPQKGVARPINRQRSTVFQSPTPRAPLTFLHDSSDSDDQDESITTNLSVGEKFLIPTKNSPKVYDFTNISDDDIPEDNGLDELFPQIPRLFSGRKHADSSMSRTYKRKKVSYKNQERQRNPLHRQMRLDEDSLRASVRKIRKPTVPKLSILDVPDVNLMPPSGQPQFLRIAMRQARSRKDQGRSSPNRKFFRMATREETKETNKMLGDWKNGTMKQALLRRPSKPERQPLQHLSTNSSVTAERATTDDLLPVINPQTPHSNSSHIESARPSPSHTTTGSSSKRRIVAAASKQPKLVKRSILNRAITSLTRDNARPVVSEIVATGSKPTHDGFSASLAAIQKTDRNRKFTLERFLAAIETNKQSLTQSSTTIAETTSTRPLAKRQSRNKLPRKRVPIRAEVIDVDPMPGTSSFSLPFKSLSHRLTSDMNDSTKIFQVFRDTESFTIDFDILPIRKETFFHSSTFIGDGAFSSSLNISRRNMDLGAGFATTTYRHRILRWGPWNEQVTSELTEIFDDMNVDIARNQLSGPDPRMDYTPILSFMIRWITCHLHFVETMDRVLFVDFMKSLVCNLANQIDKCGSTSGNQWMIHSSLLSLTLILANQVRQITNHEKVDSSMRKSILDVLRDLSRQLLSTICKHNGLKNIRKLYEASRDSKFQESGIRDGFPAVEAYIILLHVLRSSDITRGWLNELLVALLAPKIPIADFQHLEDSWMVLFTLIPLNEFDELGLGRPGIRFREKYDNWPLVQSLVMAVFNLYLRDPNQPMQFLKYCRFVLQRCLLLLMSWGWRDCRDLLSTLFEFYAKNMMYNLKNEHSFGSPAFLEDLDSNPTIEIEPSDSSFHLFLKIIGSGLRYLSQSYDTKAMRNMTWRLLPNHGRAYPKEKPLDHEDLDALRNHHDLLCTLYWAVPDSCRPRLQTIRDLIDPATSHLETCNLSIRSWRRLVHFKLSTNEEDAGLKPFAEWYRMFTEEVVRQHQLAKTETEAQARDQILFSKQDVEVTVSHNQRRIEAVISSAIAAMDSAVQSSRSFNQACLLVDGVPFAKVCDLFAPTNPRVNPIISDTLQLAIHFLSKDMPLAASGSHIENDDSQEYGDWSAIEEAYDVEDTEKEAPVEAFPLLREVLLPCVAQLLSNCFGEDTCPDDVFLVNVTECWSCIAHASVKNGLQHWDSYLNPYSKISWAALRLTPQTKTFGPRFLASCVEKDQRFYAECRLQILTMWASCVVEKKSALKFQPLLTETLLNVDETPLMRNLPFHRKSDGRYHVSTLEFSERRISLISSLFSNMREHLQSLETSDSRRSNVLNEYREILNAFMTAMKLNHQELAQSETEVQSQYVTFVQSVISFMQQHTQSICRLDRYFTDPATFPLPSGDPGYVAAKLKSYGVRLPSLSAGKELIGFVQGICQSAAVGDKQAELIDQLCDSMSEAYESGNEKAPTLRSFLFHCVFPIYIECALSNAAAWILAIPITKVVCRSSRDLLYEMDINDRDSVASVNSMSYAILQGVENLLLVFFSYRDFTGMPQAPLLLRSCMDMVLSLLPVLDYIGKNDLHNDSIESILGRLHKQTTIIVERLLEPSSPWPFDHNAVPPQESVRDTQSSTLFTDSRAFAKREIQSSLRKNWSKHGGRYFVLRGGESTEVKCELVRLIQTTDDESTISSFLNMANDFLSRWSDSEQLDYQYFSGSADEANAIHELDDVCI